MMLAMGFRRSQLVRMVLLENVALLVAGVAIGTASALVAVAPQLAGTVANVQWGTLSGLVLGSVGVGVTSCWVAAEVSMRGDLVAALRSE